MSKNILIYSIIICCHVQTYAQATVEKALQTLISDPQLAKAHIGISIWDNTLKTKILDHDANKWYSTASTLKILTTSCALEVLGPNFRFKTEVFSNGYLDGSTLRGDIIIKGSGDPTLGSSRYNEVADSILSDIAKQIISKNIKQITGNIIFDISHFDINPIAPKTLWLDMGNYFSGAVWPINIEENIFKITFSRTEQIGDSTKILNMTPPLPLEIKNKVTIGGNTDEAFIFCAPYSRSAFIKGTLPPSKQDYTIKGSIPNPMEHFGRSMISLLKKNKISLSDEILYTELGDPKNSLKIWEHYSPKLSEILKATNWFSINLYAEAIFKAIAFQTFGEADGLHGVKAIEAYLKQLDISTQDLNVNDGSGISPTDMASPKLFTQLLFKIKSRKWFPYFFESLSSSGGKGTLATMGKGTDLEGRLWAKSGNMDGICSYSGYMKTKAGRDLSFTILINGFKLPNYLVKQKVEQFLLSINRL